jgi:hypothetical protein
LKTRSVDGHYSSSGIFTYVPICVGQNLGQADHPGIGSFARFVMQDSHCNVMIQRRAIASFPWPNLAPNPAKSRDE